MDLHDFQIPMDKRKMRRTYLVTYSQADRNKFPTRESFGQTVADAFCAGSGKVGVAYWSCAMEPHVDGGEHYHMAVKLTGPKRWLSVKQHIFETQQITLNFSQSHDNYYTAYQYITKSDPMVFHSLNHPNLKQIGSPRTKQCIKANRRYSNQRDATSSTGEASKEKKKKSSKKNPSRLSNLEVSDFMIENNIKSDTELFAVANEQKNAGKKDLANFVLSRSSKSLQDLISSTWRMQQASTKLHRRTIGRMERLRTLANDTCVEDCNENWFQCATEVLRENKVHPFVFAEAMRNLLVNGRGKYRNVLIVGPTNCGKTFLLSPLQLIFETFSNPANDKYAWLGAEEAEVIFLNDFRWSSEMIAWKELLLLLEGQTVHLPSPKNHYSKDITISSDVPVFATAKSCIEYRDRFNATDPLENDMMSVRWKVFQFFHQIPKDKQKDITSCPKCFAKLVLLGEL